MRFLMQRIDVGLIGGLLASGILLSGCAAPALQTDVKRLDRNLTDLRGFESEQTTKLQALESQLRELQGRVEELEYSQSKKLGSDLTALRDDVTALRKRVPPPAIVPTEILENDEVSIAKMPSDLGQIFTAGYEAIRNGKFEDAEARMQEALDLSRSSQWTPDAAFWLGLSREGSGNAREALEAYHTVVTSFPKSRKAPVALLRQASIFGKLGDAKLAKVTLKKLISDYPASPQATDAKVRLKMLS